MEHTNDDLFNGGVWHELNGSFSNDHARQSGQVGGASAPGTQVGHSGARIDYLSILLRGPFDYCQQIIASVQENCRQWSTAASVELSPRVRSHGALPSGDRGYTLEWWGLASDTMAKLLPQHLLSQASRVDYRQEHYSVTEASIEKVAQFIRTNGKQNRNIQTFTSRKRTKMNGRNSGGIGLAVGSHKSDTRISFYRRADETGAIEIQYSGKALHDVKIAAAARIKEHDETWYEAVSVILEERMHHQATQVGFDNYDTMCYFLASASDQADAATGGFEFQCYQFETWYQNLGYKRQVAFLRTLGLTPSVILELLSQP